jgi:hypothetical protein
MAVAHVPDPIDILGEFCHVSLLGSGLMAGASRLAVTHVSSDGVGPTMGRRGCLRFTVVGLSVAGKRGRRCSGAVAATSLMEEVVQMTEPLTKDDLVAYLVSGCKPKENWRSEDSIFSPPFLLLHNYVVLMLPY